MPVSGEMERHMSSSEMNIADREGSDKLNSIIKFLIRDNAFSTDFLLTTILEYIANNDKSEQGCR